MVAEVKEYLTGISKLLSGQLRGGINAKAREENEELIMLTMGDIFEKAFDMGKSYEQERQMIKNLKNKLDDNEE